MHEGLRLTRTQLAALGRLNAEVDGPLLALRNWPAERASEKTSQLIEQSHAAVDKILTGDQQQRLSQIMLRVQGIQLVLTPKVAQRLRLSQQQQDGMQKTLDETATQLQELKKRLQGGESPQEIEGLVHQAKQAEQTQVLNALSNEQKQLLWKLLGSTFQVSQLGRVSFKAPKLADSAEWIDSEPLRLEDLPGRVVAVHFWAFG